jgi:hypothetical protein
VIDGDELGDGYQIAKERRIKHGVPDWVMTWHGFARVCLLCGGVEVKTRRAGKPVNPARRASILYLYFVIGLSDSHIAESLNVSKTYIKYLVQDVRKRYSGLDPEISPDMEAQIKASVRTVMSGRPKPVVLPKTEDEQEKEAEREVEVDEWENIRLKIFVGLGASTNTESILRPRRRSQWKTSDTPHRVTLQMLGNLGRKVHRAVRVQLKAKVLRRLDDIPEKPPGPQAAKCMHGLFGPDTCSICTASKPHTGAPLPAAGPSDGDVQTIYEETRAGDAPETIYGDVWLGQESDIFKPIPANPL